MPSNFQMIEQLCISFNIIPDKPNPRTLTKIYYTIDSIANTSIVNIWCEQVHVLEKRHCRIRFSSWHKMVFENGGRGCSQQSGPMLFQYLMETPQKALTTIWQNKYTTTTASKVVNNRRARLIPRWSPYFISLPSPSASLSKYQQHPYWGALSQLISGG